MNESGGEDGPSPTSPQRAARGVSIRSVQRIAAEPAPTNEDVIAGK